jgi:hypothetical protein
MTRSQGGATAGGGGGWEALHMGVWPYFRAPRRIIAHKKKPGRSRTCDLLDTWAPSCWPARRQAAQILGGGIPLKATVTSQVTVTCSAPKRLSWHKYHLAAHAARAFHSGSFFHRGDRLPLRRDRAREGMYGRTLKRGDGKDQQQDRVGEKYNPWFGSFHFLILFFCSR